MGDMWTHVDTGGQMWGTCGHMWTQEDTCGGHVDTCGHMWGTCKHMWTHVDTCGGHVRHACTDLLWHVFLCESAMDWLWHGLEVDDAGHDERCGH